MLRVQSDALARERNHPRLTASLHREAQRAAGEVADQGLAATSDELAIQFVLVVRERIHRVEHECVLGLHELLDEHRHVEVVEASARFGERNPWSDGEQGRPNALDRVPSVAGLEQILQALLPLCCADLGHRLEHLGFQLLGHGHRRDQDLGLLEDELRVLVARFRLQLAQHLLERLQDLLLVCGVAQRLLHAAVGERHGLRRQDVLRQLRLQQGQVQALRAHALLRHLVGPDAPLATHAVRKVHLHLRGLELFRVLGHRGALGGIAGGARLGLHVEGTVRLATDLDPLALEILGELLGDRRVEASGEEDAKVPRSHSAVRQDVRGLLRGAHEHPDDAVGDLLLAADGAAEQYRGRLEDLVLDVQHLVDQTELAVHGLAHGRDHLPRRQVREAPEDGLEALEHQADGDEGGAAEDLVHEDVDRLLRGADLFAQESRLGAHERLAAVAELADDAAGAVRHRLEQQGAVGGAAAPLLMRAITAQGRDVGQNRLQLVLHRHVADQRHDQALELVRQRHEAVL
mmetsp:Transcript_22052/g.63064  ORF Transcript_22052/g.63064 Transcript_22052/m.63064 type:complete len:519 (-) Transcript_22052:2973-4529(-)